MVRKPRYYVIALLILPLYSRLRPKLQSRSLRCIVDLRVALQFQALHLDWRPMLRDGVAYALSIGFFILFAWDGVFEFYEAAVLLVLYLFYIVLMKFNPRLMDFLAEIG